MSIDKQSPSLYNELFPIISQMKTQQESRGIPIMKKKSSFLLLIIILVFGVTVCANAEIIRIKDGNCPNVRTLPSTDGEIIGIAKSNQIFEVLSVSENNWYKIRLDDGSVGWIAGGMGEIISSQDNSITRAQSDDDLKEKEDAVTDLKNASMSYIGDLSDLSVTDLTALRDAGFYSCDVSHVSSIIDLPNDFTRSISFFLKVCEIASNGPSVRQDIYDACGNAWMRILEKTDGSVNTAWTRTGTGSHDMEIIADLYVSILGDSMSAYKGYIPAENRPYYPNKSVDVDSPSEMWWSVMQAEVGFKLLINDSWSGSSVSSKVTKRKPMSTLDRTQNLHSYLPGTSSDYDLIVTNKNIGSLRKSPWFNTPDYAVGDYLKEVDPDIVILTGGGNDYLKGAPIGTYDGTQALTSDVSTFRSAYANMINRVRERYPKALVICAVPWFLVRPAMESNSDKNQEDINAQGIGYVEYRNAVEEIAKLKGCPVISLYDAGFSRYNYYPHYADDSSTKPTHMNKTGHKIMGKYIANQILDILRKNLTFFME